LLPSWANEKGFWSNLLKNKKTKTFLALYTIFVKWKQKSKEGDKASVSTTAFPKHYKTFGWRSFFTKPEKKWRCFFAFGSKQYIYLFHAP
jgi:hypothetical protein